MDFPKDYHVHQRKKAWILVLFLVLLLLLFVLGLSIGSSGLSFWESMKALFGIGEERAVRIVQKIRLPRVLSGLFAGMGLALSGLILQSCLDNPMASPATLGVSDASVLGANLGILLLSGGYLATKDGAGWNSYNPYAVSSFAFLFALGSTLLILLLSKIRNFEPSTMILSGIALSFLYKAIVTLIQYFATDVQLTAAVYWSFGDLSRSSLWDSLIMGGVVLPSFLIFFLFAWRLNALSLGEKQAKSLGVKTGPLRLLLLSLASLMTATCIAFLGVIGFVGLIAPHVMRKILGNDHRYLIPGSALFGAILLLASDTLARLIMNGITLPVGAVTSLLGAPFFLYLVFAERKERV